jgi:hypothetical protein
MAFRSERQLISKRVKAAVAVLLLPLCFGTAQTILHLIRASGQAETVWVATVTGVACWLVVYLMLPKPMRVYVFGHELTHALWTWVLGGEVKRFKASARGGHVVVSKSSFIIALAPYFFPIYAMLVVLVFCTGHWIWRWNRYLVWFHLLLGAAYAFHLTLTWHILKTRQSDITEQGYLFSAVVIWLGNASILVLGIPLLTRSVGVLTALNWCWAETERLLRGLGRWW